MDYGAFIQDQERHATAVARHCPVIVMVPQTAPTMNAFGGNAQLTILKPSTEDDHSPSVLATTRKSIPTDDYNHYAQFDMDKGKPGRIIVRILNSKDEEQNVVYYTPSPDVPLHQLPSLGGTHRVVLMPVQVKS